MEAIVWFVLAVAAFLFKDQVNALFSALRPDTFESLGNMTIFVFAFFMYALVRMSYVVDALQQEVRDLKHPHHYERDYT